MNITREVILDLLPLYVAGEASPSTRRLVEEYLEGDPSLAERVRVLSAENLVPRSVADLPPDLELKALRRTKRVLALQRWLFAAGIAGTAIGLAFRFDFHNGRVSEFRPLFLEQPLAFGTTLLAGVACLFLYHVLRRRQRTRLG